MTVGESVARVVILGAALYLVALGAVSVLQPARAARFLSAFATSARLHWAELAMRLVVGTSLVIAAPAMLFTAAITLVGWIIVGTTLALAVVPWRLHHRFASWAVPRAVRYLPLVGVSSFAGGLVLLSALVLPMIQSRG